MAITKPPVLPAWADTAANPADIVQPTNPEISAGWPLSTTPPARQRWNWVLNYVTNAVRYFSRRGLVDYDADETYSIGDIVRGDDGAIYKSLVDTNLSHTPSTSATQWGSPTVPTAAADDSTTKIASTAYVLGQLSTSIPAMNSSGAIGTSKKLARADHVHPSDSTKANTNGTYPSLSVGFASQAGQVSWPNITLKPTSVAGYGITDAITTSNIGLQSVAYANSAGLAYPRRSDGTPIAIIWSGQAGQPNWLLGSADGSSFYVFNPANFSVNFATSAGSASSATSASFGVTQVPGTRNTTLATTAFACPAFSHGSSGYEKLPSGLILQWGQVTFGDLTAGSYNRTTTVNFPVTFPNGVFVITCGKTGNGTSAVAGARFISTVNFQLYMEEMNSVAQGGDNTATWFAIGY